MHRGICASVSLAIVLCVSNARADHTQIGAWFGPRLFAGDCSNDDVAAKGCRNLGQLGFIEDAPAHPKLENTIEFGLRVARPFLPWLVPELELGVAPTKTNAVGGAAPASVVWLDPRLHVRFEIMPNKRLQPFFVVGGGSPIALSGARKTFSTGIVGDGYFGGGIRFDTQKGFAMRFDLRVSLLPGATSVIVPEMDIGFGLERQLGVPRRRTTSERPQIADRDGDGIPDDKDMCVDRPEDFDGFEDADGCPDIDNDGDGILDVVDKCPNVPETYNGYADDDGCPDTVPAELDVLRGTIEGLIYAEAETQVRASAKPSLEKIAKLMLTHPSIRIVVIGHTDDREAKQFAEPVAGQPKPDLTALSADLSRARASMVKASLVTMGIAAARIDVEGQGSEHPVVDNDKPRNRLANRRVEVKLYVPPSAPRR
jgi:outer membrane protein OmpA-like peptidoglycan-associated protein